MSLSDREYMRDQPSAVRRAAARPSRWARWRFALWLFWRGLWARRR
jgi:hypothetical protein